MARSKGTVCRKIGFCDFRCKGHCTDRRGPCYKFMVADIAREKLEKKLGHPLV